MKKSKRNFRLEIPLDASMASQEFEPDMALKVMIVLKSGERETQVVKLSPEGRGVAEFSFPEHPGDVQVLVGPETASDEELEALQTIRKSIPARHWQKDETLQLSPIPISSYYWHWWRRWCRIFTIRGQVICPNGDPVPGAKVCAKDVDRFWFWTSTEEIACATTDANGVFEISFRWCCGWWPWWWLRRRFWEVDTELWAKVQEWLHEHELAEAIPFPGPRPDPWFLEKYLDLHTEVQPGPRPPVAEIKPEIRSLVIPDTASTAPAAKNIPFDPAHFERIRPRLAAHLPKMMEQHNLKLYPWYPWLPWWDCSPDVIFTVTQIQGGEEVTLLEESPDDTRWNIETDTNVILVANENAWCLTPDPGCAEGNCMSFTTVCGDPVDEIGGNLGAPASPRGYLNPGLADIKGDRPYADVITIHGTSSCLANVDYYEFEWSNDGGATWNAMPSAAIGTVVRGYIDFDILSSDPGHAFPKIAFSPQLIDGKNVIETISHYESTHPIPSGGVWGYNRVWAYLRDRLFVWKTARHFPDGEYILRVVGYDLMGNHLENRRVLHICQEDKEARLVLRLDNRVITPGPTDPYGAPCGSGTVHVCTDEPTTEILAMRIRHADNSETAIDACGFVEIGPKDKLEIDFTAHDPDGHLSYFTLDLTYGNNQRISLHNHPNATISASSPQVGPTYAKALAQGAVSPTWHGGKDMRLTIPAELAFPETCSYQLELRAHKRTIVGCNHSLWPHSNLSERSFAVKTT